MNDKSELPAFERFKKEFLTPSPQAPRKPRKIILNDLLQIAALPGRMALGWHVPAWLGFSTTVSGWCIQFGFLAWALLIHYGQAQAKREYAEREQQWMERVAEAGRAKRADNWAG